MLVPDQVLRSTVYSVAFSASVMAGEANALFSPVVPEGRGGRKEVKEEEEGEGKEKERRGRGT